MRKLLLFFVCLLTMALPSLAATKTYRLCTDEAEILNPDNQFVLISSKTITNGVSAVLSATGAKTVIQNVSEIPKEIELDVEALGVGLFSVMGNGTYKVLFENVSKKYWGGPNSNGVSTSATLPTDEDYQLTLTLDNTGWVKIESAAGSGRYFQFNTTYFRNYKDNSSYANPLFYKEVVEEINSNVDPVEISCVIEGVEGTVSMICTTEGATIYYGFSEAEMTNEYSAPFKVTENCTIYAYAEKDGEKSITKSYIVDLPYTSFKKVIENAQYTDAVVIVGDFQVLYVNGDKRRLILTDGISNINIYKSGDDYTIDYAEGTKISKVEGTVAIYNDCFRLIDANLSEGGNGCEYTPAELTSFNHLTYEDNIFDEVVIKNCNISGKDTGSPIIELGDESIALYDLFGIGYENAMGCDVTGLVWRYKDTLEIVPLVIEGGEVTATVEAPVIGPNKNELDLNEEVTITCPTEGVTIYYTLDGSEPTQESEKYTAPIPFTEDCTIKARAYYDGDDKEMFPSAVTSRTYHVFDPTCNVISVHTHDVDKMASYLKHTCTIDKVDYSMFGYHNSEKGDGKNSYTENSIQMNNKGRFCYVLQASENEGYVVESIELGYNQADSKIDFEVRGANTPFDDSATEYTEYEPAIKGHGTKIGSISATSSTIEFPNDYKYFAIYPTATGAVYLDHITIRYREPAPLAAPALLGLEDIDEEFIFEDEECTFVMSDKALELDFDFDPNDNPDIQVMYMVIPGDMGVMSVNETDDTDEPQPVVYDGNSIEINESCTFVYWAVNMATEEMSEQKAYIFQIVEPFVIPAIKGLENANVVGDAENGYMVESETALSLTFDYDYEKNFNLVIGYILSYEDGSEEIEGVYEGKPIVIDRTCEMIITAMNRQTMERAFAQYMFFIDEDSTVLPAPKMKEGNYSVDGDFLKSEDVVEIEFETTEGIHIYYNVAADNAPAKAASVCDNDHAGYTKHEGEIVKLSNNHKSFSFFACDPATGAHSRTVTYTLDVATGILSIDADDADAIYFNLQGVRIAKPENGTYIRVQKGKTVKIVK